MNQNSVFRRVLEKFGLREMLQILVHRLSWSELQTFMLHLYGERTKALSVSKVVKAHKESRFSNCANVDPRRLMEIDQLLYASAGSEFVPLELSPVCPIGSITALTGLDPKVTLATVRSLEVVSDPSVALALECARQRSEFNKTGKVAQSVSLATSHRALRCQAFDSESELTSHFRAFALVSSGRDTEGFNSLELHFLATHIQVWLEFLRKATTLGCGVENIEVSLSDARIMQKLMAKAGCSALGSAERASDLDILNLDLETNINELKFTEEKLVSALRSRYPEVRFWFDMERRSGAGYYSGLCYRMTARSNDGERHGLAGGGACNWTRKLLQSKQEHMIASGFGSEMFLKYFKMS